MRHKELCEVGEKVLSVVLEQGWEGLRAGRAKRRIHVFDVESKREVSAFDWESTTKRANREKHRNPNGLKKKRNRGSDLTRNSHPTCVWKMLYLPDDTLVTADSDGKVTFYDSRFYTVLKQFPSHDADVVAFIRSSEWESSICLWRGP